MDYKKRYLSWLEDDYFDVDTKKELESIKEDDKEIKERFYKDLEFGTGGIRGIIGAGTNRMNIYTVRKATQGLANFILKEVKEEKDRIVCIAFDSRHFSPDFSSEAALVLNANGIKTYIFESLRPTPELSFAVRDKKAAAGIVVTASHNPPEYNGYKVYWSDGAQVSYPRDEAIIKEVNLIKDFSQIKTVTKDIAIQSGLYNIIGKDMDDKFTEKVKEHLINPELVKEHGDKLTIVYTPLNGAGNIPVRRVLKEIGFNNVHIVKEQELPDPNFTTIGYPNPEDPKAFTLALKLADEVSADVILATDPDCDRVGAVVKNHEGEYIVLSGNNMGVLLTDYIISKKKENNTLPKNPAVISTIVSTNMTAEIAKQNNVDYFEFLTGFKYIGEKIEDFIQTNSHTYLFGFEESYGYLPGTYARDKDAVGATMLICELATYYKSKDMNLYDGLLELYKKYGYFLEAIESITLKGIEGIANMKKIMDNLRLDPPKDINGVKVIKMQDYQQEIEIDFLTGIKTKTTLPASNVLYFDLDDESWFCVRPSGTEPKIKIYFGVKEKNQSLANEKLKKLAETFSVLIPSN